MTRQAKELEERLQRLATSIPPAAAVVDPEATQVHQSVITGVTNNSFPGVRSVAPGRGGVVVDIPTVRPKAARSVLTVGGVVLLVLLLSGGGIGAYFLFRPRTPTPTTPARVSTNTPTSARPATKADLAEIPGGVFEMGRSGGAPQEAPAHQIKVQTFFIDKTEVTNAEYAEFVRDTNYIPPTHWAGTKPPDGLELWPVVNVSFEDANAFAKWRSKRDGVSYRLPTEEEWEFAARNGIKGDLYPWGNEWKDQLAVVNDTTPAQVGSHPAGANQWGVQDLIGNVWEWTASKVSAYPGNSTEVPQNMQEWMTIRGGGYITNPNKKDTPVSSCMREFIPPLNKNPLLGFRLVRSGS